jgi:hypothetical protein
MPIETKYQRALNLAKQGKLEEAQNLLLTIDTPEAERLLDKVNKALAARNTSKSQQEIPKKQKSTDMAQAVAQGMKLHEQNKAKQGAYGCLVLIAMAVICAGIFSVSNMPSKEKSLIAVCQDALRGMPEGVSCNPQHLLEQYPQVIEDYQERYQVVNSGNINSWYDCLEGQGVQILEFADE